MDKLEIKQGSFIQTQYFMPHSQKSWVILLMNIHKPNRVMYDVSKQTLNHIWKTLMKNHIYFFLNKGNNKITELRTILQRESQNS